jgi:hypothetical protein
MASDPMSAVEYKEKSIRSWAKPMAATFCLGGLGLYRGIDPTSFKGLSFIAAGLLGAALALAGYGVGRLIDRARQ